MAESNEWANGLCGCGQDCGSCFYACCCPLCALSSARSELDSSTCCFNFLCVSAPAVRWMVRTAYKIDGDAWGDCCATTCCLPCVANQVLQTVRGSDSRLPYTEAKDMQNPWGKELGKCDCGTCMYSFFCCQCAIASATSTATGMPWCFAFCCVNMCAGRNIIRRQNRIKGQDLVEECLYPTCAYVIGSAIASFCGCACCIYPFTLGACTTFLSQMKQQADLKPMPEGGGYLSNYTPPHGAEPPSAGAQVNMVVVNHQPQQQVYQPNQQYQHQAYQPNQQYQQQAYQPYAAGAQPAPVYQVVVAAHEPQKSEYTPYQPQPVYGGPTSGSYPPVVQATVVSVQPSEAASAPPPPPYSEAPPPAYTPAAGKYQEEDAP